MGRQRCDVAFLLLGFEDMVFAVRNLGFKDWIASFAACQASKLRSLRIQGICVAHFCISMVKMAVSD